MSDRIPLIAGNWKMHHTPRQARAFAEALVGRLAPQRASLDDRVEVVLAPAAPALCILEEAFDGSGIAVAAQNVHPESEGAFTGEISVPMLEEIGCRYALIGHSERRQIFGEDDAFIAAKANRLAASRVAPILCVGETLEEREREATLEVVRSQISAVLDVCAERKGPDSSESFPDGLRNRLVVAYEPVWAIGTGRTATPEIAQSVHAAIRGQLIERLGEAALTLRILYGGSVKPSNAGELLAQPDIDGALVGGASLDPSSFADIVFSAIRK